ncbi:hypothetical protein ACFGVS_10445 [Mucilaginibacter sp. AW1-7]|uniref:hypothetical protein n=1 Tax=Mucilaginibacter sp. AW1-7 TaxID=3349874 RepID=UPI003F73D5C6
MIAKKPYILYSLPASRITQALIGGRKIENAWEKIKIFLVNCTTADVTIPQNIYLKGYTADEDHGESPELANVIIDKIKKLFGNGTATPVGYHYPDNIPTKQQKIEWQLINDDLEKAIDFMIIGQPWPKYNLGPVDLMLSYDFELIDPISKTILPNQQYTSGILVWLSRSNCISMTLWFPFEQADSEFEKYIDSIEPFLPFKFERKYLRLVRPNKKETANVFSKI